MIVRLIVLVVCGWIGPAGIASAADAPDVGVFVAVHGTVTMQPASLTAPQPVKPYDRLGPLAVIETQAGSKAKVLFLDDTLITLGERSRLEMTEQTYRSGSDTRAFVAHLTRGTARVLVARPIAGEHSIFEVHSRSAVATVRGTYFIMWIQEPPNKPPSRPRASAAGPPPALDFPEEEEGPTGVANVGQNGDITFTSGGATVLVLPGQSSIALPGSPPSMPVGIEASLTGPGPIATAIAATSLDDQPRPESPRDHFASAGAEPGAAPPSQRVAVVGAVDGQFSSGAYAVPGWPLPVTPVTPPAVVSGAAPVPVLFSIRLP
ncbi:FecR family protein [Nitrospira moscoviensis]|uniref:FecR protein domain-containing protein n=1 Tax=Nitrospira moscoviensis TaxID=42253 RepID=A0A0K2GIE4_NITMO|nr:FecR family protein [Nitrospira moscoviensis]ALA60706.1 exported protein of unknown function [Nitrospira moscoviensis]